MSSVRSQKALSNGHAQRDTEQDRSERTDSDDRVKSVSRRVDEAREVMAQNVQKALEMEPQLARLETDADQLEKQGEEMLRGARIVHRQQCRRWWCLICSGGLLVIGIITAVVVWKTLA